jgi:hypothetical protein
MLSNKHHEKIAKKKAGLSIFSLKTYLSSYVVQLSPIG